MPADDKKKKDRGSKDRSAASKTGKKSDSDKDDSSEDEGKPTPVRKKAPEPPGNLRRRAEWFKKRH